MVRAFCAKRPALCDEERSCSRIEGWLELRPVSVLSFAATFGDSKLSFFQEHLIVFIRPGEPVSLNHPHDHDMFGIHNEALERELRSIITRTPTPRPFLLLKLSRLLCWRCNVPPKQECPDPLCPFAKEDEEVLVITVRDNKRK